MRPSLAVLSGFAEKSGRHARRVVRVARRLPLEHQARQLLGLLGRPTADQLRVSNSTGWVHCDANKIGNLAGPLARARSLGEAWAEDRPRWEKQRGIPINLINSAEMLAHRDFMDIALQEDILRAVADYLGQVPRLYRLYVWWSPPNDTLKSSQLFHYDHRDSRQAKVFINLREVTEKTGPLYFFGADQSPRFDANVGYTNGHIKDEKIYSVFDSEEIHNSRGPAGTAFIIDTGRCLHYGSRGNTEGRLMLMASFTRVNCVDAGHPCPVLDPVREEIVRTRYHGDAVRTFVLTAPQ